MTHSAENIERSIDSLTTSWIEQAKRGDEHAWQRLDEAHRRLVRWWCLKAGIPHGDVQQVVQNVFNSLSNDLAKYKDGSFRGWLWKSTKWKIKDYWRHRNKLPAVQFNIAIEKTFAYVEAESSSAVGSVDRATKIIFDAIVSFVHSEFADADWRAFCEVVIDGKPPAEVAEELNISRNRVFLAKSRILRRIREVFAATKAE